MSNFGQEGNTLGTFGSVPIDGTGAPKESGSWCYSQDIRFQFGLSQGDLQGACEQLWRFSVNVKNTNISFKKGQDCYETGCPIVEKFTITNEEFKYRNSVGGPPFNYDTAANNLDWVTQLCSKRVIDDPLFLPWDFQYIADVRIEGCTSSHPTNTAITRVFRPNPKNPSTGNPSSWKVDTDCTPSPVGPNDEERRNQLNFFKDCLCSLKDKYTNNDIDEEGFDDCFAAIMKNYIIALRNSYPANFIYDPNDPDTYNELEAGPLFLRGCADCAE
jgi:hypothetical protein